MPLRGGHGGPLGHAPSRARQAATTGASAASPLQELQDSSPRIVTSLRTDRDPGASLCMPSSRDALPSRDGMPLRDALSSRKGVASRSALSLRDTPPMRSHLSPREGVSSRDGLAAQNSLPSRDAASLRPTLLPEAPLAPAKAPIFASTAWLRVAVLATGGALGFLWATPANQQAGEEAALVSLRETPRPAAQNVAAMRPLDPSAAVEQAAIAALYQDFLKWRQLRGR